MWGVCVCFSAMLGFLASFRPLPLYESDRVEGWFLPVLILNTVTDVDFLKESWTLDLIPMRLNLFCIKMKNL